MGTDLPPFSGDILATLFIEGQTCQKDFFRGHTSDTGFPDGGILIKKDFLGTDLRNFFGGIFLKKSMRNSKLYFNFCVV